MEWFIPNRLVDGYSFGPHSVSKVKDCNAKVVISVDSGTASFDTISQLVALGVDVIVTDHHEPPPDAALPPAIAILNPKLHGIERSPLDRGSCPSSIQIRL